MSNVSVQANSLSPMKFGPLPDKPLVSILISSYNYAPYLGEAIESVLSQTYNNLEAIICDDGSTDGSAEIAQRYLLLDRRVKTICQPNGGQALALNTAFRASAGDIICLLDADDTFLPSKLQHVVNAFIAEPDSGLAVNRMRRVNKERRYLGEVPLLYELPAGWKGASLRLGGPKILEGLPPCSGLSMRRSLAEAIFPLPIKFKAYADSVIQGLAPLLTSIAAIQIPLSEYRVHGSNVHSVCEFTDDRLRNLVLYEREFCLVWRRCFESTSPRILSDSQLPSENVPSVLAYAYARFCSDPRAKTVYKEIPTAYFRAMPRVYRWYWRLSRLLPDRLFRKSFNFVHGQTRAKMLVGRVLKNLRNCQWFKDEMPS
jgi:glycosyltransferase involved in cell wall biosynthesis